MDGTTRQCPLRVKLEGFRYALCKLYSTPGPHSDSKISKVLGGPMVRVRNLMTSAEWKLKRHLAEDDPGGKLTAEAMQEV
jgi:hypothetical protein